MSGAAQWMPRILLLSVWVALLLAPPRAHAQASAGIAGTIRDAAGTPVPSALIVLTSDSTGVRREVRATERGAYEIPGLLPASTFQLEASAAGFAPSRQQVSALTTGERRLVDLRLAVAGVTERVDVLGDASASRAISPELGGDVEREQLDRIPVNGRDLVSVAYLVPGAAPARGFYNLAPRLSINGSSSLATNYTIDGFDNTDLFLGGPKVPATIGSVDSLKVLVNAYAPEYGRTGNGVVTLTTRSGGNRRAGAVFYTGRPGAALDSPNVFAPRDARGEVIDDNYIRHQSGGSIGGAFIADRLFYFGDLEITRERQDAILTSPLAAGLAPTRFDSQTGMLKLDRRWTDSQISTLRYHGSDYTHDGDVGFIGGLTLPSAGLRVNYRNHVIAYTHRSATTVGFNEAGVQFGRLRADWAPRDVGPRVLVTDRGATLATIGAVSDNFFWTETDVQLRNVYTRLMGRHTVKAGGDLLRGDFNILSGPGARGAYVVDLEGRQIKPAGAFLALSDIPRDVAVLSYSQSFINPAVAESQTLAAVFVEDTFRATADLTLTLGARWDYDSVTNTPIDGGDYNNLAPRLGVSWTPRGSARHQLRGGYGIFYERIPFAVYSDTIFNSPQGGAVSVTFARDTPFAPPPFPNALPGDAFQNLPVSQLPPRNVQVFDPNLRSPWTEQVSAGYVVNVTADLSIAADYVHARGRNLIRRVDTNAPASVAAGVERSVAAADAARPIVPAAGGFRLIEQDETTGHSNFDGLYVHVRQRPRNGIAVDVAYTLSRIENDTDDINFRPVDSRRADDELGPSLNDRRHVLAVNGLVQIPRIVDLAPVLFVSSGQPLNVTTGRDDNGDTIFNDRPVRFTRNSERTAGFAQLDFGLIRNVPVGAARLQLRADIFNVFNRTNFSGFFNFGASGVRPDESGTLAFRPTAAGPARQFQFSAGLRF